MAYFMIKNSITREHNIILILEIKQVALQYWTENYNVTM